MSRQIWILEPGLIFLTIIPKMSDQQGFADYSGIWIGAHLISTSWITMESQKKFWHWRILISILFSTEVQITEGQIGILPDVTKEYLVWKKLSNEWPLIIYYLFCVAGWPRVDNYYSMFLENLGPHFLYYEDDTQQSLTIYNYLFSKFNEVNECSWSS